MLYHYNYFCVTHSNKTAFKKELAKAKKKKEEVRRENNGFEK